MKNEKNLKLIAKRLLEAKARLNEQTPDEVSGTSGCLDPDDNMFCDHCQRDCIGEIHEGVVYSTLDFGLGWNWSDNNDDLGNTCCCDSSPWRWQGQKVHHPNNPCCYGNMPGWLEGDYVQWWNGDYYCSEISGCMDPNAANYVDGAYADCSGNQQSGVQTGLFGADWDTMWGENIFFGINNELGDTCCCEYGQTVNGIYTPNVFTPSANANPVTPCPTDIDLIDGCTDPQADNYNPDANNDDGSCDYGIDDDEDWDEDDDGDEFIPDTSLAGKKIECYYCEMGNRVSKPPPSIINPQTTETLDGNWVVSGTVHGTPPVGGARPEKPECPKGWTTNPNPCPGVSPVRQYIECYKCDMDGQTVLSQSFPTETKPGECPQGWGTDPNPCPGVDLVGAEIECPHSEFSCDLADYWINEFMSPTISPISTNDTYFCQGCNNDPELGIFNDSWESYVMNNHECFFGSLAEVCECKCGTDFSSQIVPDVSSDVATPLREEINRIKKLMK